MADQHDDATRPNDNLQVRFNDIQLWPSKVSSWATAASRHLEIPVGVERRHRGRVRWARFCGLSSCFAPDDDLVRGVRM